MSDTTEKYTFDNRIMITPVDHQIVIYNVLSPGIIFDTDRKVVHDLTANVVFGTDKDINKALARGRSLPAENVIKSWTRGIVLRSHITTESLGEYPSIITQVEIRVLDFNHDYNLNTAPAFTKRHKLDVEHASVVLEGDRLEQRWPDGSVHTIDWNHPFTISVHRSPHSTESKPSLDVHIRLQQTRDGQTHVIALTLALPFHASLLQLQPLYELLPRVTSSDARKVVSAIQESAHMHGVDIGPLRNFVVA